MKFDDFELDLTKLTNQSGINPLEMGCEEGGGGSSGTTSPEHYDPVTSFFGITCSCFKCK